MRRQRERRPLAAWGRSPTRRPGQQGALGHRSRRMALFRPRRIDGGRGAGADDGIGERFRQSQLRRPIGDLARTMPFDERLGDHPARLGRRIRGRRLGRQLGGARGLDQHIGQGSFHVATGRVVGPSKQRTRAPLQRNCESRRSSGHRTEGNGWRQRQIDSFLTISSQLWAVSTLPEWRHDGRQRMRLSVSHQNIRSGPPKGVMRIL